MQRDVTVHEVMDDAYVGVSESDGLLETVELLLEEGTPVAVVLQGSEAVGACSGRDVLELLVEGGDPSGTTVEDAMTDTVHTIRPDRSLAEARDRMAARTTGWLLVTDGNEPLGVLTEHDLLVGSALGEGTASGATEQATESTAVAGSTATASGNETTTEDSFDDQGICEICGKLTHDLSAFNGQLRCGDCRNV